MQVNKLKLSEAESAALSDKSFFLLKHSITAKIVALFGDIEPELKKRFTGYGIAYEGLNISSGKIFRGENYLQYPYILLDYPRLFSTNDIFAFRSMLWWGHEFSFTLHLQHKAFALYGERIFNSLPALKKKQVYYCVNDTPWQYNFNESNYQTVDDGISRDEFFSRPFIKLSRKIPATDYIHVSEFCFETFELFFGLLKNR